MAKTTLGYDFKFSCVPLPPKLQPIPITEIYQSLDIGIEDMVKNWSKFILASIFKITHLIFAFKFMFMYPFSLKIVLGTGVCELKSEMPKRAKGLMCWCAAYSQQ